MVGVDVPLARCEHQYVLTEPVKGLAGATDRQWDGGCRYRRGVSYAGPLSQGDGVGNYGVAEPPLFDPEGDCLRG
jgi:hypothetical protein